MNLIADEILSYVGLHEYTDALTHYGMPRRSGRYPWGSGENPFQRSGDFLSRVEYLKSQGLTEAQIREDMGLSSQVYRDYERNAKHERKQLENDRIRSLKEDGLSTSEIGRIMGMNESSIRSRLDANRQERLDGDSNTASILRDALQKHKIIDVGEGVNLDISKGEGNLRAAIFMLENEGYKYYKVDIPQATNPGKYTTFQVLARDDISYDYVKKHTSEIMPIMEYKSDDIPSVRVKKQYPASMSSDRIDIRYDEQGGSLKDGVIEIRPGVADLDLGNSHYAQVRILVDGTHYLKGMAMYSNDIPDGKDIVFNTNKAEGTPKMKVLKPIKDDPINPFGAEIKEGGQSEYIGKDGKKHLSAINKLKEEGDWDTQSKTLSSQFLGKQPVKMIETQLEKTYDRYEAEYNDILKLTNPVIKQRMLEDFAGTCDSAVTHLKAVPLPGQTTKVILPLTKIKENECYAPTYKNGEKLALVRFPHGGIFEIPILTVNNNNQDAVSTLGNVSDAIGIHAKTAEKLSGADFDGDTVLCIPTHNGITKVQTMDTLEALKGFDPKKEYKKGEGTRIMSEKSKQTQMGIVSNLITDMTLAGATPDELARAVKHSMVVIDAVKHELDYKRSEQDNDIAGLKRKYQGGGGAHTLLSKRKQDISIPERAGQPHFDPESGNYQYRESGRYYLNRKKTDLIGYDGYLDKKTGKVKINLAEEYIDASGKTKRRPTGESLYLDPDDSRITQATDKVKLLSNVKSLHDISSGTIEERIYADYGDRMKKLAADARRAQHSIDISGFHNRQSENIYKAEVESLKAKVQLSSMNAPRERRAQAIANSLIFEQKKTHPELINDKDTLRKLSNNALKTAREQVGASRKDRSFDITDKEWAAIQAGAVTKTLMLDVWRFANQDDLKRRAMPRSEHEITGSEKSKIRSMYNSGKTYAEIAQALGLSTSTIAQYV